MITFAIYYILCSYVQTHLLAALAIAVLQAGIQNYPVKAGFVGEPERWRWSSACDYAGDEKGFLPIGLIEWTVREMRT